MTENQFPEYRLFGRRQDRPLKQRQDRLMKELLPEVAVNDALIDEIVSGDRPVWLEIGFGGGEHLAWQARQNPDVLCIGAEPFINGVAKLLSQIDEHNLDNVRVLHGDIRPFLEKLPEDCLDRIFILHPDPWPKKRHHKRRIVSEMLLNHISRALKQGGELRVASDIPDYIRWTLMHVQMHNQSKLDFKWTANTKKDWADRREDWPQTRYEAKAIREGRIPTYLSFDRL